MIKVSVIVAAYNVEKYIEDTLHSLANQIMENAEFIVVDDCSTDKTGEIIKSYAKMDSRFKYVKCNENKGPMLVRKIGIEQANGEYIMFLDGDDTLEFAACETAYNTIRKQKVDLLQFETNIFIDENAKVNDFEVKNMYSYLESPKEKILAPGKAGLLGNKRSQTQINFSVWNKIYKKSLVDEAIKHLPERKLYLSEDLLFSYITCFFAKSYSYTDKILYNYRYGNGVSTSNVNTLPKDKMQKLAESYYVYTFLKEWTEKQGCSEICKTRLNTSRAQITSFIFCKFLTQTPKAKIKLYTEMLLKYCPVDEYVTALCSMLYRNYVTTSDKLAEMCTQADVFKPKKKTIKTIGTFYFRMNNGGIENVLSQLTDIWVKSGYDVVLFTDKEPNEDDYYIHPAVKRVVLPEIEQKGYFLCENRIQGFRENLLKYDVDVMVYHAWTNPTMLCDILTVKSLGVPLIVHTHNIFCVDMFARDCYAANFNNNLHKIYRLCDMTVTLTDIDQAYWSAVGVKSIKTVNPIAFPLDTALSKLNGKEVVMISRISPEKNIIDGIKIIESVVRKIPDVTLTIVGSGNDKYYVESVKNYIKENNLEDTVKMVGFKKDVTPYYQSADVMLITSKVEGFCLTIVESKLCGLPLVTYDLPNLDTVREEKGMFVVEQNDIDGAAKRIIEILSDDNLKKEMGKEARKSGEEILDFDIAGHWDYIFEQTLIPKEESLLSQQSDISTAINILLDFNAKGILVRGNNIAFGSSPHTAQLEATIKEIRSSTSYRLGWFLTTIPRKIKDFIKGQKYVE